MSNPQFPSPASSLAGGAQPSTSADDLNGGWNINPLGSGISSFPGPASVDVLGAGGFNSPMGQYGPQNMITDPNASGLGGVGGPSFGPSSLLYPSMTPFPLSAPSLGGVGGDRDNDGDSY